MGRWADFQRRTGLFWYIDCKKPMHCKVSCGMQISLNSSFFCQWISNICPIWAKRSLDQPDHIGRGSLNQRMKNVIWLKNFLLTAFYYWNRPNRDVKYRYEITKNWSWSIQFVMAFGIFSFYLADHCDAFNKERNLMWWISGLLTFVW